MIQRQNTSTLIGPGNPIEKWRNAYKDGDVNRPFELDEWRNGSYGWVKEAPQSGKYLEHIKLLASRWPHLQILADFMDVGTTPLRWNPDVPGGFKWDHRETERNKRTNKTRVCILEYPEDGGVPEQIHIKTSGELVKHLAELREPDEESGVKFRLFVVEDLSREVIEALGSHYNIDPSFFREHILDYIWYNIKDWWRDPPNLDIVSKRQNWFQMRFSRARYFRDADAFQTGETQSQAFNVYRRLESDSNSSKFWDTTKDEEGKDVEARIGTIRSRATMWIKPPDMDDQTQSTADIDGQDRPYKASARDSGATHVNSESLSHRPTTGILLLDPTVEEGHPLWRDYRNWTPPPPMGTPTDKLPTPPPGPEASFFEEFIFWASKPDAFSSLPCSGNTSSPMCLPTKALLHMVCNEWLTLVDYIKTRLNQVDWEIAFPGNFLAKDEQIEKALKKLHHWRRVVPVYRAMLGDTFLRVFREAKHPERIHPGRRNVVGGGEYRSDMSDSKPNSAFDDMMGTECINAYWQDYQLVLNYMEEYQNRIDRLTEVVTAVISIQDSRRGYKDNKNLQWLTWLATFFIPLSFVATMLSMTTDPVDQLGPVTILWAQISLPSGILIMSFVLVMSIAKCRRAIRAAAVDFPWVGKFRPFDKHKRS